MRKSRFLFTLPLMVLMAASSAFASTITLGSIATNNIVVLGYNPSDASNTNITVNDAGGHINVGGNVASPTINNAAGLTFVNGGTTITSGSELTNAENDLASTIHQLGIQTGFTSLTFTSGAVNVVSTPGNYMINGVLGPGTVIDLTGNGQYIFETSGSSNLNFTSVTINDENAGLKPDEVFWYTTGQTTITNSTVYGDIVQNFTANTTLQTTTNSVTGTLIGRLLSQGDTTFLNALNGSTLNIDVPEPASLTFVFLGLGSLVAALRRRRG
jgi:PEP-CTERM motif